MEYCCHGWAGAPSCYLDLLDKVGLEVDVEVSLFVILIDCMIFLSPFVDVTRMSMSTVSQAKLWNSLPIECLPLTYELSGFKSRINRHLLTVGSF